MRTFVYLHNYKDKLYDCAYIYIWMQVPLYVYVSWHDTIQPLVLEICFRLSHRLSVTVRQYNIPHSVFFLVYTRSGSNFDVYILYHGLNRSISHYREYLGDDNDICGMELGQHFHHHYSDINAHNIFVFYITTVQMMNKKCTRVSNVCTRIYAC